MSEVLAVNLLALFVFQEGVLFLENVRVQLLAQCEGGIW